MDILFIFTFFRELFDVTLRLLVNLTNPELLLFKEELPEDKETRNYYLQIQVHTYLYIYSFSLHRAGDILLSLLNRWAVGNRFFTRIWIRNTDCAVDRGFGWQTLQVSKIVGSHNMYDIGTRSLKSMVLVC